MKLESTLHRNVSPAVIRKVFCLLGFFFAVPAAAWAQQPQGAAELEHAGEDAVVPPASGFEKVVLMHRVTDPMELGVAADGRVFVAERGGPIKMWNPETGATHMVGYLPVNMTVEDGLLGLTLDPAFEENGWLYVYYAPADGGPQRLSRLTYAEGRIDPESEKILLRVPVQREKCCHSGGSLAFGPDGTLYLSTGDNSDPYPLGGSAIDERPGRRYGDAQRTSANTNDLRGKILRIRPLPDGTYAIPQGNLFSGDALHRPEIYTMGHRNPYRISVDPKTGTLYWGDVGIGNAPSEARGPWGWEEINQARRPGFFGWPYFVGPNDAYRDYDYETGTSGPSFDPDAPVNASPNNTGARTLPPAQPAMIWYTYGPSEEFPELGAGGMSAMAGPVYRYDAVSAAPTALPPRYDGSLFIYEWMRNWIKEVRLDEHGDLLEIHPFLPEMEFARPTDLEVGPDGRLYVIEWGDAFWGSNENAQVVRLDYHGAPISAPAAVSPAGHAEAAQGKRAAAEGAALPDTTGPAVSIAWPPDGGVFDYDEPIPYRIEVAGADRREGTHVAVQPYTGHDTHAHPLEEQGGEAGTFRITRAFTHVPDLHFADRFAVLEVRPAGSAASDAGPPADRVVLQPRRKEAEHYADRRGAERKRYGKHPAEPDFAETALTTMQVDNGDYLAFSPLNLAHIEALRFRVKPEAGGTMEVRLDAPEGLLLGEISVAPAAEEAAGEEPHAPDAEAERETVSYDEALAEVPDEVRNAYEGWQDLTLPIEDPGGSHTLYLVFHGERQGALLQLDRIDFVGRGAAGPPPEHDDAGPGSIR